MHAAVVNQGPGALLAPRNAPDPSLIEVRPGYWRRAGELRAKVLAKRRKARLGDALIAQSCIDHGIALLTRDRDFRAFAGAAGLDLVIRFVV